MIGSTGLSFRKPQPLDVSEAPAVAAVPSEPPPDDLLAADIGTNSSGQRYDDLGDPQGWPGIAANFKLEDKSARSGAEQGSAPAILPFGALTGFEPDMAEQYATIPKEWQDWRCLWFDPVASTPRAIIGKRSMFPTRRSASVSSAPTSTSPVGLQLILNF